MAVSITVNLNTIDKADSVTGWNTGTAYSGFEREASGNLGGQASNGYLDAYHTDTGLPSFADVTVFGWMNSAAPYLEASNGFGIIIGDGTNIIAYTTGGADNFGHFVQGYANFRLDTSNLPTNFRTVSGSEASLNLAAIEDVGISTSFASKAVGNSDNVFWDVIRYIANGTAALVVGGGGASNQGTFAEIVADDASTATGKAYGVARSLLSGAKNYAFDYAVDFGNSGSGSSYFEDSDFQLFLNGTGLGAGHIDVTLLANSSGTNLFKLDSFVIVSVGAASNWDLSTANSDTMELTNGQFTGLGTLTLPVTGGTSRKVENVTFVNCGQVNPSTCTITNLTFLGSSDANGALLGNRNLTGHSFTSDGTGHAIYITSTGTYDYTDLTYSGYASTDGSTGNEVIYNNSGGAVTINVSGGNTPTVRNGTGASTTVNSSVPIKVTTVTSTGTAVSGVRVYLETTEATPTVILDGSGTTDVNGEISTTYSGATPQGVTGNARKSTTSPLYKAASVVGSIGTSGLDSTVVMISDE